MMASNRQLDVAEGYMYSHKKMRRLLQGPFESEHTSPLILMREVDMFQFVISLRRNPCRQPASSAPQRHIDFLQRGNILTFVCIGGFPSELTGLMHCFSGGFLFFTFFLFFPTTSKLRWVPAGCVLPIYQAAGQQLLRCHCYPINAPDQTSTSQTSPLRPHLSRLTSHASLLLDPTVAQVYICTME